MIGLKSRRQGKEVAELKRQIDSLGEHLINALAKNTALERRIAELEHPELSLSNAYSWPSLETVVAGLEASDCFVERVYVEEKPSGLHLVVHSPYQWNDKSREVLSNWQSALERIGFALVGFGPTKTENRPGWEIRAVWRGKEEEV